MGLGLRARGRLASWPLGQLAYWPVALADAEMRGAMASAITPAGYLLLSLTRSAGLTGQTDWAQIWTSTRGCRLGKLVSVDV